MNGRLFGMMCLVFLMVVGGDCRSGDAAALIQGLPTGQMNWLNGTLRATGIAKPTGKRALNPTDPQKILSSAKVAAQQNLLKFVKQIRISSLERVETLANSDPLFMAKIQELIKQAPVVKQFYLSDGTVTIILELSLSGAFYQLVMPHEVEQIDIVTPVNLSAQREGKRPDESIWTGLVIDAYGLTLNPALVPRIVDERGDRIYGPEFISRDFAVRWGGCGYISALDPSVKTDRIGSHPMIVRGIRVKGPERTDIVISTADASRIRAAAEHVFFMREGRVVVLVD